MTLPTKREVEHIKQRADFEHATTLPDKTPLQIAKQNILYCGSREATVLSKRAYKFKVRLYKIKVELLRLELGVLRSKITEDVQHTLPTTAQLESGEWRRPDPDQLALAKAIEAKQRESADLRTWLRNNKEFNKYESY